MDETKKCESCGLEMEIEAKTCDSCGEWFEDALKASEDNQQD